jgi:Ca-activated chloride channel family protein
MKRFFLTILLFVFAASAAAQSGRVKSTEKPVPETTPRERVVYIPTERNPEIIKPSASPTPAAKTDEVDGDVIRVEAALVPIPVSVVDTAGRAVTNLRLEDFHLEIDGKTAEISEISRSQSPVRLALLFDNSSSVLTAREFEQKAAIRFFRQVIRPDKDQAALFTISTAARLEQPLTSNVSRLIQAIQSFPPPEGATALLDGIIKAADYLQTVEGRRVIVIVSDGEDTYSDLDTTLEKTVQAVQRANCQVYVVKTKDFENFKQTGNRGGNANIRSLTAERRMQEISGQTGGTVYSPIDDRELDAAFTRISAELSDQYVLSYYPEDAEQAAQFRNIAVRVKTGKDLTVRTRKGYYVSRR